MLMQVEIDIVPLIENLADQGVLTDSCIGAINVAAGRSGRYMMDTEADIDIGQIIRDTDTDDLIRELKRRGDYGPGAVDTHLIADAIAAVRAGTPWLARDLFARVFGDMDDADMRPIEEALR